MQPTEPIQFEGEPRSNDVRAQILKQEPFAIRTFTPSQCVISHSAGSYHYTPEGRKLADFTSGVLVANLGHNPVSWWNRISDYLGLPSLKEEGNHPGNPYQVNPGAAPTSLILSRHYLLQSSP